MFLVTGSSGFIGSRLCQALVERGASVRAFHRATSSLVGLEGLAVEHAIGDLTRPETLAAAMRGVEGVFHAGALLQPESYAGEQRAVIVGGTRVVLQAAIAAGVRKVVHTSSVAALGIPDAIHSRNGTIALMDENHSWNYTAEGWPYGFLKYQAELEVQKAVANGLDVVIVNPAYVLGAGEIYRRNRSMIHSVVRGKVPVSMAGGLNIVHIDDVIEGHLRAMECGQPGKRYLLGGENLTHTHFLEMIARAAGVRPPVITLPAWAAGMLKPLIKLLGLPVGDELLRLGGRYFYFDLKNSQEGLALPPPKPVERAVIEAVQDLDA